jgi:hypothetical protein
MGTGYGHRSFVVAAALCVVLQACRSSVVPLDEIASSSSTGDSASSGNESSGGVPSSSSSTGGSVSSGNGGSGSATSSGSSTGGLASSSNGGSGSATSTSGSGTATSGGGTSGGGGRSGGSSGGATSTTDGGNCPSPFVLCPFDGGLSCTDTQYNPYNCGGCDAPCLQGQLCEDGGCVGVPSGGDAGFQCSPGLYLCVGEDQWQCNIDGTDASFVQSCPIFDEGVCQTSAQNSACPQWMGACCCDGQVYCYTP